MKKLAITLLLALLMAGSAFGSYGRKPYVVHFVDELGNANTGLTSVEVQISGGSTATVYGTAGTTSSATNPIVDATTLATGTVTFYYAAATCTLVITDGTDTRTVTGITPRTGRVWFSDILQDMAARTVSDSQTWVIGTGSDYTFDWDNSSGYMTVIPVADDTAIRFGNSTGLNSDMDWFADTDADGMRWDVSDEALEFIGTEIHLDDDSMIELGTSKVVTLQYDGTNFEIFATAADTPLALGSTSGGFDLTYYFATAGQFRTDHDGDFMNLTDDMDVRFGTGASADGDFMISGDSAPLLTIDVVAAGVGEVAIGNDADDVPVKWYAETTADWVYFNADEVEFEDVVLQIMDDSEIHLGDDDDVTLRYDETTDDNFEIAAGSVGMSIVTNDFITTTDGAAANQFKVDATGTVAGYAAVFETTDGGIQLNADGAENGDIAVDAADDLTLTAAGDLTLAVTGTFAGGGATMDNFYSTTEVVTGTTDTLTAAQSGNMIIYTMTGGACTVTLPEATSGTVGMWFILVDGDPVAGEDLVITPEGVGTINGDGTGHTLTSVNDRDGEAIIIFSTAADTWYTVAMGSSTVWTEGD